ncbi:MAG: PCMD domain-containing protein [Alistipes sp.]|nr:PCMD domain-containing protein [Alistipes sp.]
MRRLFRIATAIVGAMWGTSCIENTIPYPVVEIELLSLEGEGFTAQIDPVGRVATLILEEEVDPAAVEIRAATISNEGRSSLPLVGVHDLREQKQVILSRYQEYRWTLRATQQIERTFQVEGQIGQTEIDPESRTATLYVAEGTDLSAIRVTALKLGPRGVTTMTPSAEELTDFRSVRFVYLQYPALHGATERWQLYVLETDIKAQITAADLWATRAYLYGAAEAGTAVGFRYREQGTTPWLDAPEAEQVGGTFTSVVTGLKPETAYEFVAYSNSDLSPVVTGTTEPTAPLTNGGFEFWSQRNEIVYPYLDEASAYWGTGNVGAAIVGVTLTEGVADIRPGSAGARAARLSSKFASVLGVGKFAAGNLFVGSYVRNDGTNGIVHFGRPFTRRPVALRGWVKYHCGTVDRVSKQPPTETMQEGDPDCGMIFIALGDWTAAEFGGTAESPVEIATRRIEETAFNTESHAVIAYGELPLRQSVEEWMEFTIPLDYRSTSRIPTHLVLVCSSSRYGDYFTGSTQSVMWLDDFELVY